MTILMNSVDSSSIAQVGYRRRTLKVQFNNGRTYEFSKVPRSTYDKMLKSESKGEFFNQEIRSVFAEKQV